MSDVTDGIRDYLASGGLFNPELMDHQRVRDLLIESRDEIERLRHEVKLRVQICADATLYARRLQEAADEIERLRGLLRWHLNWMHDDHSDEEMEKWDDYMEDWEKRVREALGDD